DPMRSSLRRGFTLVEILIVVVLLGILAAIVVPSFARASNEARIQTTYSELRKIRRHVEVFRARNSGRYPGMAEGDGTWGEIVGPEYLMSPPVNSWVGGTNAQIVHIAGAADVTFQSDYGWIFDDSTGQIWAGSFDANDVALPRPGP